MKIGATINANNGSILTDEINVVTKMLSDCGHDVHYHTTRGGHSDVPKLPILGD